MKPLSEIPVSRPAANARSPKRKPRSGNLNRLRGIEAVKVGAIAQATTGKSIKEITKLLKLSPTAIYMFRQRDPEFRAEFDEAIASAVASARGKGAGMMPLAMEVIDNTLTGKNTSKLKYEAAHDTAKGFGVLVEKSQQETEVKGVIGLFNAEDLFAEYRAAKKRLSEGGG